MKISDTMNVVKVAMMDTAQKASVRRLNVLRDRSPCKPTCHSCCSRLIYISIAEGLVIYSHLVKAGIWNEVRERAKEQVSMVGAVNAIAWFNMNRSCPVLNPDTKLCEAYPIRPSPCSIHFVTSDPSLCDPWSANSGAYQLAGMDELHEKFVALLERQVAGRGVLKTRLPLQMALMFAEKIQVQTNMSFEDILSLISSELG